MRVTCPKIDKLTRTRVIAIIVFISVYFEEATSEIHFSSGLFWLRTPTTKAVGSYNLTPFTPCPLFPLTNMERGTGGEVKKPTAFVVGDAK